MAIPLGKQELLTERGHSSIFERWPRHICYLHLSFRSDLFVVSHLLILYISAICRYSYHILLWFIMIDMSFIVIMYICHVYLLLAFLQKFDLISLLVIRNWICMVMCPCHVFIWYIYIYTHTYKCHLHSALEDAGIMYGHSSNSYLWWIFGWGGMIWRGRFKSSCQI